jgi:hypothetical protein
MVESLYNYLQSFCRLTLAVSCRLSGLFPMRISKQGKKIKPLAATPPLLLQVNPTMGSPCRGLTLAHQSIESMRRAQAAVPCAARIKATLLA